MLLLSFLLVACASVPPPDPRARLTGEWLYSDATQSCRYVFAKDGSFSGEVKARGTSLSRFTGKWAVERDTLLYEYTGDALGRIPPGTRDRDQLLKIAASEFVIQASDGSQRTYRRVR
jgi:hypothetical protein